MNRTTRRAAPDRVGLAFRCVRGGPAARARLRGAGGGADDARRRVGHGPGRHGRHRSRGHRDRDQRGHQRSRTAVSDAQGFYRVAGLEPGRYTVRTELAGFSTVEKRDVPVRTASEVSLDVELKVGGTTEVDHRRRRAGGRGAEQDHATIGLTSTARQAVELPLSAGRQINNLILLTPNTFNVTAANNGNTNIGQGSYVINGQRSRNNNYMIDGSDNNDISVTIATSQIVPEAVAEFQVQTNAYSVEFGRNSGGQINLITKSGTNRFRGEAWEYYTTSELYSLTNIEKDTDLDKPARYHRNQFGARHRRADRQGQAVLLRPLPARHAAAGRASRPDHGASPPPPASPPSAASRSGPGRRRRAARRCSTRSGSCRTSTATGVTFRNLTNTLVNGVPIETGQTNVGIVDPSTYKTALFRLDFKIGQRRQPHRPRSPTTTAPTTTRSATASSGERFCGSQDLKDTNIALSETHTFSASVLNEARLSLVKRDLLFPENDPTSPTATHHGPLPDRRRQQLPAGPRLGLLAVLGHGHLAQGQAHAEVRRGHPLQQAGQHLRLQLQGRVHVQQPAGLHEQPGAPPSSRPCRPRASRPRSGRRSSSSRTTSTCGRTSR